jgi:hypothetical protein
VAVPSLLSWNVTVPGSAPTAFNDGIGFPVVLTVKVPFEPTVNVVLLALVIAGGTWTVTVVVRVTVAGVVAVFVTVNVYVVVAAGEMFTGVPLVTAPTPLSTLPVPLLNTAVRVVEFPETIVANPGVKLVIVGAGTTVTVACLVTKAPAVLVTVSVYVVVDAGDAVAAVPLVTTPTLLSTLPVPLLNTPVKVVDVPAVMVAAAGVKLVITGAATTVTVTCLVTFVFAVLVTVNV